ncbi:MULTISPECIES: trp operon leader peptide [Enterobacter cloacae complex]|uniref:trp operon leader peptide n=2 Tax=Enterobacter cloacae complex TaxID=354276 RepID=A0A7H8UKU2_ENTCL|nr:trp operon leader peptide [Enterobacter cloacae]QLA70297.1 trp operon leader peptide [Enterobacter pasteurii]HAS1784326.1 trp operon leader peptide [Enterobacter pasteurii]HBH7060780.1 trp operon leader peptide [Enterobacter cloacae]HBI6861254.1 trp operon leader peptide [Enterobacter pasteurii]
MTAQFTLHGWWRTS